MLNYYCTVTVSLEDRNNGSAGTAHFPKEIIMLIQVLY